MLAIAASVATLPPRANALDRARMRTVRHAITAKDKPGERLIRIDFGDGETVDCNIHSHDDFKHMLLSVGAAGIRRKGMNGFPTHTSPLIRDIDGINAEHEYLVWPWRPDSDACKMPN